MSLTTKLLVISLLLAGLSYAGYRVHDSIWQAGYTAAMSEVKAASEAADRENEQTRKEEAREIAAVVKELEDRRKFYKDLIAKAQALSSKPVIIERDPVTNVEIIRVFGLSDDGLRLFNDAIRGEKPTPQVRQYPPDFLSR